MSVLFIGQMSKYTPWYGPLDPRLKIYSLCDDNNLKQYHAPAYGEISRDIIYKILKNIEIEQFNLILFDDNMITKDMGSRFVYDYVKRHNLKIMACPHGNVNYENFRSRSSKMKLFVFGPKDKRLLDCDKDKLICGGIPENDILKNYKLQPQYILFILSTVSLKYKQLLAFNCFTPQIIRETGIFDLCKSEKCELIIKCKTRYPAKKQTMKDYECLADLPTTIIFDSLNEGELVAKAKYVISAPSTLAFKPIQMGIPTVLLKDFGQVGSLIGFPGLCSADKKSIFSTLERQITQKKQTGFIKDTLTGGLNFNSTGYYLSAIEEQIYDTK